MLDARVIRTRIAQAEQRLRERLAEANVERRQGRQTRRNRRLARLAWFKEGRQCGAPTPQRRTM